MHALVSTMFIDRGLSVRWSCFDGYGVDVVVVVFSALAHSALRSLGDCNRVKGWKTKGWLYCRSHCDTLGWVSEFPATAATSATSATSAAPPQSRSTVFTQRHVDELKAACPWIHVDYRLDGADRVYVYLADSVGRCTGSRGPLWLGACQPNLPNLT